MFVPAQFLLCAVQQNQKDHPKYLQWQPPGWNHAVAIVLSPGFVRKNFPHQVDVSTRSRRPKRQNVPTFPAFNFRTLELLQSPSMSSFVKSDSLFTCFFSAFFLKTSF